MIEFRGHDFTVCIPQEDWPTDETTEGNVDVLVRTDDGRHYAATAYTAQNIAWLMDNTECDDPENKYYFADPSMLVVRTLNEFVIRTAVAHLLATNLIERVFEKAEAPDSSEGE